MTGILQTGQSLSELFDGPVQAISNAGASNAAIEALAANAGLEVQAGADLNSLTGQYSYAAQGFGVENGMLIEAGTNAPALGTQDVETPAASPTKYTI